MKRIILLAIVALTMGNVAMAQSTDLADRKEMYKERKANKKLTTKEIEAKNSKVAKKQAKEMKKDGWKSAPGRPTLEKQLNDLFLAQYTMEGDFPKYIVGTGTATGGNYAAARKQALELARVDIAAQIESEVAELVENNVSNKMLNDGEVESITTTMASGKTLIKQKLGKTLVIYEVFREKGTKQEVQIFLSYDGSAAKSDIMKAFENKSKELQEKVSKMLDL